MNGLQVWNGVFFDKTSLKALGLRVQLGHTGAPCACPIDGPSNFCVVDVTGIHLVAIAYCDCRKHGLIHKRTQILRAGWFPATFNRPQTVFTFDVLSTFHELTLQGKTALYDYYHTILRQGDNAELRDVQVGHPASPIQKFLLI